MSEHVSPNDAARMFRNHIAEHEASKQCIKLIRELKPGGFGCGAEQTNAHRVARAVWLSINLPGIDIYREALDRKLKPSTLLGWLLAIRDLRSNNSPPKPKPKNAKKNVSGRMFEQIGLFVESSYWTQAEWAEHLKCSTRAIADAEAWRYCVLAQERSKAERAKAKDRRRKPKGSDQRRAAGGD